MAISSAFELPTVPTVLLSSFLTGFQIYMTMTMSTQIREERLREETFSLTRDRDFRSHILTHVRHGHSSMFANDRRDNLLTLYERLSEEKTKLAELARSEVADNNDVIIELSSLQRRSSTDLDKL